VRDQLEDLSFSEQKALGKASVSNLRKLVERAEAVTHDDLDYIVPEILEHADENETVGAVLLGLAQLSGYLDGVEADLSRCGRDQLNEAAKTVVDGIERGMESIRRTVGGEEGRRLANSIRDTIEKAIGGRIKPRGRNTSEQATTPDPEATSEAAEPGADNRRAGEDQPSTDTK
jgi:hypothetical protein